MDCSCPSAMPHEEIGSHTYKYCRHTMKNTTWNTLTTRRSHSKKFQPCYARSRRTLIHAHSWTFEIILTIWLHWLLNISSLVWRKRCYQNLVPSTLTSHLPRDTLYSRKCASTSGVAEKLSIYPLDRLEHVRANCTRIWNLVLSCS